jgi:Flavin containing amine oxidoreductase/Cyclic nucleotide-binding domain
VGYSTYVGGWDQLTLVGQGGLELDAEDKQRSILAADAVRDALDALRRRTLNDDLPDRSIGLDVRLGQIVHSVEYRGVHPGMRVATAQGTFEADAAIVTFPLGVLKSYSVQFNPPLPAAKRIAIERLDVGYWIAYFDEPFWPRDQYAFGCIGRPVEESPTCILNLWKTHRVAALVLSVGGPLARAVEAWPEGSVRTWTVDVVRHVSGSAAPEPRRLERTRWQADPFARGAYSYIAMGATPADLDVLAEPVDGRLFFAGEATVRQHWATAHSAYVSGLREAARISGQRDLLPARHFTENRRWREMMHRANRFFNLRRRTLPRHDLDQRLAVLRLNPIFAAVPPAELHMLASMFDVRAFGDGESICTAGDRATDMYVIEHGAALVEVPGQPGRTRLERGDAFGEYGMFGDGRRSATIWASGSTHALVLDYQRFQRFLLAFPESMHARLDETVQRLLEHEARVRPPGSPPLR